MFEIKNLSIKLKENIDKYDYDDIKALEKLCIETDNTSLKLEIDYKLNKSDEKSESLRNINEFMYYEDNKLIGYIGICQFGGCDLEVNGMVHPAYRRNGVFKKLFSLVIDEWNKRKSQGILLLSDNKSYSGLNFIKNICDTYDHSEYEMYLNKETNINLKPKSIILRPASDNDKKEIAKQNSIYFGSECKEEDISIPNGNNSVEASYIAEIDNKIIGKVNVEINEGIGGIYGLGVLPEYRSRGYGREILLLAIEELREKSAQKIMLQVDAKNKNALNLYKSCGFEETNTMDYFKLNK